MMNYDVVPHQGVGPVRLGMSRAESRAMMGLPMSSLSSKDRDYYHGNAFQVFFDNEDKVEYIELSKDDSFVALYKGFDIHKTKAEKIRDLVEEDAKFDI